MSYPVHTKAVPAQRILRMTRDSFVRDLQAHLDGSIKTLTIYAQAQGVQLTGLPMAMYHAQTVVLEASDGANVIEQW